MFTHSHGKLYLPQKLIALLPDLQHLGGGEAQIQIFVYLFTDTSYVTPENGGNNQYYIYIYVCRYITQNFTHRRNT